jgi:hypothetical protein
MPRSRVALFAWLVAIAFILGTVLQFVDRLNLVATPPNLPDTANMVDRTLATVGYRQAIWPVFLWTNLLFAIGFVASVAFAFNVAAAAGARGGLSTFKALAATGGILGLISSIIPIGSVEGAVWLQYCDCGFKETEIVSQIWAQMVAQGVGDWLFRIASVTLAVALIGLVREAGAVLPPLLRTWTYLTAAALALLPILITIGIDPSVGEVAQAIIAAVLIPVWAVWLGRSVEGVPAASA